MYNPIEKLLNEHNDKKTPLDGRMLFAVCLGMQKKWVRNKRKRNRWHHLQADYRFDADGYE